MSLKDSGSLDDKWVVISSQWHFLTLHMHKASSYRSLRHRYIYAVASHRITRINWITCFMGDLLTATIFLHNAKVWFLASLTQLF